MSAERLHILVERQDESLEETLRRVLVASYRHQVMLKEEMPEVYSHWVNESNMGKIARSVAPKDIKGLLADLPWDNGVAHFGPVERDALPRAISKLRMDSWNHLKPGASIDPNGSNLVALVADGLTAGKQIGAIAHIATMLVSSGSTVDIESIGVKLVSAMPTVGSIVSIADSGLTEVTAGTVTSSLIAL